MKRQDAIEIRNFAGSMLLEVERALCWQLGLPYPLGQDVSYLPGREQQMLERVRMYRQQLADKVSGMIEEETPPKNPKRKAYVEAARLDYETPHTSDGGVQVDDDAQLSVTENGAWVQAWVFVHQDEVDDVQAS